MDKNTPVKSLFIVLILGLVVVGCSDDEFDDTELLNSTSGTWSISFPYIGFEIDGVIAKYVSVNYPYLNYKLAITPNGKAVLSINNDGILTVISSGTVKGISKDKLAFDNEISSKLKEIGNFEIDSPHREYRIIESGDLKLEINYSFKNSSGKLQYEGFRLDRIVPAN